MKILLYQWKAYSGFFLEKNLIKLGHDVVSWSNSAVMVGEDSGIEPMINKLKEGFDLVFSYNYFVVIAKACKICSVPYASWTQDSPSLSLFDNTTFYDTNYFFSFDSEQYMGLKNRGIKNAFYFPLAIDCETLYSTALSYSFKEKEKFSSDVSFVGSLYSERDMLKDISALPEYIRGYLDGVVKMQLNIPQIRFSQMQIADNVMQWLKGNLVFKGIEESQIKYEELIDNILDRECTVQERRLMLTKCKDFDFNLYTMSDTTLYPYIKNCGTVDYYSEMPKVFNLSRINLNVSLRSIRAGIPLRILDVLACGGFLLTNAQSDLFLFFEDGTSIVTFQTLDEMKEKIEFYLCHESERMKIAEEGRKIVNHNFDYSVLLPQIFKYIELN